jgi:hypothetical protein
VKSAKKSGRRRRADAPTILLFVSIALLLAIGAHMLWEAREKRRRDATDTQLWRIKEGITLYWLTYDEVPSGAADMAIQQVREFLRQEGLDQEKIEKLQPQDAWGRTLVYKRVDRDTVVVRSLGANGRDEGGQGDDLQVTCDWHFSPAPASRGATGGEDDADAAKAKGKAKDFLVYVDGAVVVTSKNPRATLADIEAIDSVLDYLDVEVRLYREELGLLRGIRKKEDAVALRPVLQELARKREAMNEKTKQYAGQDHDFTQDEGMEMMRYCRQLSALTEQISAETKRVLDIPGVSLDMLKGADAPATQPARGGQQEDPRRAERAAK